MERFSAIKSCWGGAAVSSAEEEEREEKCTSKTTNWKPMLQTISEECPTPACVDSRRIPVKARTKSAARARPPPPTHCHVKDNWKCYTKITLPALSPTPFLF